MAFLAINIAAVQTVNAQVKKVKKDQPVVSTTTTNVERPGSNLSTAGQRPTTTPTATREEGKVTYTKDAKTESEVKASTSVTREPVATSTELGDVNTKDAKTESEVKAAAAKKERRMVRPTKMNPSAINGSALGNIEGKGGNPSSAEIAPSTTSKPVAPNVGKPKKPADPKQQTEQGKVKTDK